MRVGISHLHLTLLVPHWDFVGFASSQFGHSQIQQFGHSQNQQSRLRQIPKPSLKTHINKGESTHPYPDYPVSQAAPEFHHENVITGSGLFWMSS